ncbi:MAG: hypothetical protein ABI169_08280 [Chitinophagaceae bacterium]
MTVRRNYLLKILAISDMPGNQIPDTKKPGKNISRMIPKTRNHTPILL